MRKRPLLRLREGLPNVPRPTEQPLLATRLEGLEPKRRGKVRDIFEVDDGLLLVATDRISAFDVVMNEGIPHKGRVLTFLSEFWFTELAGVVPSHLVTTDVARMPEIAQKNRNLLEGRTMFVRRADPLPVEFVVRGYLAGSGLAEYRETGSICGVKLPKGLTESSRLPEPILTPTTKEHTGHDLPIDFQGVVDRIGKPLAEKTRDVALELFRRAHARAEQRGLLLADTKFEFGLIGGELAWIDEALTPDSSRYWAKAAWKEGEPQNPFDKQLLRNHLLTLKWNKKPPPPPLPADLVQRTSDLYLETAKLLTGRSPLGRSAS
jgi:phosphoribosylaminoimidazole-succinocarboxamide synthase